MQRTFMLVLALAAASVHAAENTAAQQRNAAAFRSYEQAERDAKAKQQSDRSLPITGKTREPAGDLPEASDVQAPPKAPVNGEQ